MTTIAQEDLIRSVADALQFISYYHPADYIAALGAAYLAGVAEGVWASPAEVNAQWSADASFVPAMDGDDRSRRLAQWRRAIERSRDLQDLRENVEQDVGGRLVVFLDLRNWREPAWMHKAARCHPPAGCRRTSSPGGMPSSAASSSRSSPS